MRSLSLIPPAIGRSPKKRDCSLFLPELVMTGVGGISRLKLSHTHLINLDRSLSIVNYQEASEAGIKSKCWHVMRMQAKRGFLRTLSPR